jgi:regulator of sigma E protease
MDGAVAMILTILAFLVTLGVLVVIHEYGHYKAAVLCNIKVLRFSVGFGHVIWRYQKDSQSTEFVVAAVPLGGYVRMLDEREAPVDSHERERAFNQKPLWQRSLVVAAGPLANLLLAMMLYAVASWIGTQEVKAVMGAPAAQSVAEAAGLRSGDWVQAVSRNNVEWTEIRSFVDLQLQVTQAAIASQPLWLQLTDRQGVQRRTVQLEMNRFTSADVDPRLLQRVGLGGPFREAIMGEVQPGEPAAGAGLQKGDVVMQVNGIQITDGHQLHQIVREFGQEPRKGGNDAPLFLQVQRGGQQLELSITPKVVQEGGESIGRIGAYIGQAPETVKVQYGFFEGTHNGIQRTWEMSVLTLRMFGKMLIGEASLKNLTGPITIADYAGQTVRLGLAYYLGFLAVVSVSLGVINLLPLPMLDGGHLMYHLFEALTGRPPSDLWLERLQRGGVAIIFMMMSLALYNDITRLLGMP